MAIHPMKKRKHESSAKARLPKSKRFKKQKNYSSGSEEESEEDEKFVARDAPSKSLDEKAPTALKSALKIKSSTKTLHLSTEDSEDDASEDDALDSDNDLELEEEITDASGTDSEAEGDSDGSAPKKRKTTKRNDPSAFANSLSTILSSRLPTSKRVDPVLARSRDAQTANHELAEEKLETKAKRRLKEEKRIASEKGRVKDVLLGDRSDVGALASAESADELAGGISAAQIAEQERRLRKTAQRGVVKLFNAVRAAQVRGEEAVKLAREKGVVGEKKREEKVGEMGRSAFLEMVGAGGK